MSIVDAQVETQIDRLRGRAVLPLMLELWNGRRYAFSENPTVTLRVASASALRYLMKADLATLGEAYVEGHIDIEGPIADVLRTAEGLARELGAPAKGRLPTLLRNMHSRKRDAAAIEYHYDVSNEFYALWLDPNMVYSCAYYRTGEEDLPRAQEQKLDHICRKLRLRPGEKFLDIGCGWGALIRWAARHYGVDATGITLSRNQHALANERIRADGLEGRCRALLQDYRDVPGEGVYDKISSVGMFEHVGLKNLPVYFGTIHRLLSDGGIVMNHGITAVDTEHRTVGLGAGDFIEKYVFPHGELPHLSLVTREISDAHLEVMDVETLRLHYAKTLWAWSRGLEASLDRARAIAGDKRARIWRTYLAGCAHAFEQRWVTIHQVLAVKASDTRRNPLPWSRAYMYEAPGGSC
jgi:cyclopropane-fatty-acyl-phospholipid synthase